MQLHEQLGNALFEPMLTHKWKTNTTEIIFYHAIAIYTHYWATIAEIEKKKLLPLHSGSEIWDGSRMEPIWFHSKTITSIEQLTAKSVNGNAITHSQPNPPNCKFHN